MAQKTNIEWTATILPDGTIKQGYTSNPLYVAEKTAGKQLDFKASNAEKLNFHLNEKELLEIIKLNNRLAKKGETTKLFLCDMTDIFLENHTDEMLDKIFATMALCPNITFQVLTKRAERMRDYCSKTIQGWEFLIERCIDFFTDSGIECTGYDQASEYFYTRFMEAVHRSHIREKTTPYPTPSATFLRV